MTCPYMTHPYVLWSQSQSVPWNQPCMYTCVENFLSQRGANTTTIHPSIMPLSPTTRYSVYINLCQSLLPSRNCKTAILRATQTLFLPWPSALGFSFVLLFFWCPVYQSTVRSSIWGWSQQLNIVIVEWNSGFQFGHFCAHNKIVYIIIIFEEATYTQYCQRAFWVLDSILLCLCKTGWSPAVNHGASVRTDRKSVV